MKLLIALTRLGLVLVSSQLLLAQAPPGPDRLPGSPGSDAPPFLGGPGGPGGSGGRGPGGMGGVQPLIKIVPQFDKDGDGRLDLTERKAAREFLAKQGGEGKGRRGPWGPRGGASLVTTGPGPKMTAVDAKVYGAESLYDVKTLRTFFFEFENADWENELADFHKTDVEVPAKMTVDGKIYPDVGLRFRGNSSYNMVGEGQKRSLNVSVDFAHPGQNVGGYRSLNLLNAHEDPSFIRPVLFSLVAREYVPTPKANMVRVVINGEYWGVYVNQQQFNKEFTKEWYQSTKGSRWKVPGSPGARGGLEYLGNEPAAYQRIYDLKTKDSAKPWADLIHLCQVLNETPVDQLEAALIPLLDVDEALRFLALDNALVNNDGFWIRASDYSIYEDEKGRFHILPCDINETFSKPGGPGFGGGGPGGRGSRGMGGPGGGGDRVERARPDSAGGPPGDFPLNGGPGRSAGRDGVNRGGGGGGGIKGVELDPLYSAGDASKAVLFRLLAVPKWRTKYLGYVRDVADKWLDWPRLGPVIDELHTLIASDVKKDTRKLESWEAFTTSVQGSELVKEAVAESGGGFGPPPAIALKAFADQRRAYLLKVPTSK